MVGRQSQAGNVKGQPGAVGKRIPVPGQCARSRLIGRQIGVQWWQLQASVKVVFAVPGEGVVGEKPWVTGGQQLTTASSRPPTAPLSSW